MTVKRLAVSFEPGLAKAVRAAAGKSPTSTWLAEAARMRLRAEGLLEVVKDWELEHGELTQAELRAAERRQRRSRSA